MAQQSIKTYFDAQHSAPAHVGPEINPMGNRTIDSYGKYTIPRICSQLEMQREDFGRQQ